MVNVVMERLLTISKELSQKVESNEGAANELLQQCEELQQKVKAMIQVKYNSVGVGLLINILVLITFGHS